MMFNLLLIGSLYGFYGDWEQSWTKTTVQEAEAVASITCSGHGRASLEGSILHGKPACECNACYGGPDCSQFLPQCIADADRYLTTIDTIEFEFGFQQLLCF